MKDDPALWGPGLASPPQMPICTDGVPSPSPPPTPPPPPPPPPLTVCPVPPLPAVAGDNCTQTLERYNATRADRFAACGPITPAMRTAEQCFSDGLSGRDGFGGVNDPSTGQPIPLTITADVRSNGYQQHFVDIWDKMIEIDDWMILNSANRDLCVPLRAAVANEKGCDSIGDCLAIPPSTAACFPSTASVRSHCLASMPTPVDPNDTHVQGIAIDVSYAGTVTPLAAALRLRTPPETIQGWLDAAPDCSLTWGYSFRPRDPVHFQLRP